MRRQRVRALLSVLVLLVFAATGWAAGPRVRVIKTPDGGIQPQAAVDARGVLHLIYFKGEPGKGDLFYVRREPGKEEFSQPIRVNSQRGSAIAIGTIRGGQLAVGKDQRVHVTWNASDNKATFCTRLDDAGTAFEPQRNLMRSTIGLDGGGAIAADLEGNVYVAWHGRKETTPAGEANRQVWLARSADDGKTFSAEEAVSPKPTGVCGCCTMRGFADGKGNVYLLYRSASEGVNRDMYLLVSRDRGKRFQPVLLQQWSIANCPLSSESLAQGPGGVVGAWEAGGQVYFGKLDPAAAKLGPPQAAPRGDRNRKHPALAINARGEMLLAWAEGTGWQRGGPLAWQLYDKAGKPTAEKGRVRGRHPGLGPADRSRPRRRQFHGHPLVRKTWPCDRWERCAGRRTVPLSSRNREYSAAGSFLDFSMIADRLIPLRRAWNAHQQTTDPTDPTEKDRLLEHDPASTIAVALLTPAKLC